MAWTTLNESQLEDLLSGAEKAALKAFLASGQENPVPGILARVAGLVRGKIAANDKNTLGEGDTLPATLLDSALVIARHRLLNRLPMPALLTEGRRNEYRDAMKILDDVASGGMAVERPDSPTEETTASATPRWKARTRRYRHCQEDGA